MSETSGSVFKFRFDTSTLPGSGKLNPRVFLRLAGETATLFPYIWFYIPVTVACGITFVMIPDILGRIIDIFLSVLVSCVLNNKAIYLPEEAVPLLIKSALLVAANLVLSIVQGIIAGNITTGYSHRIRTVCFNNLGRMPLSYFDTHNHGYISDILTERTDSLDQSLNIILVRLIPCIVTVSATVIKMITLDAFSGIFALITVILTASVVMLSSKYEKKKAIVQQAAAAELYSATSKLCMNLRRFRDTGAAGDIKNILSEESAKAAKATAKARFSAAIQGIICEAGTGICIIGVLALRSLNPEQDSVSIGLLLSAVLYCRRLFQPVSQATLFSGTLRNAGISAEEIYNFLELPLENESGKDFSAYGNIEFRSVSFTYPSGNKAVLQNLSFTIPNVGISYISGETGAGKSTVIKLMLRLYAPTYGSITNNSVDIREFSLQKYRSSFSYIPQNATLFEYTIAQNIAYGTGCCDMSLIKQAAKKAGADSFIEKLPDGYNTVYCRESSRISNGEAQLILLSRALLKNSHYIIFDEAASFVDSETIKHIYNTLETLAESKCIIIISHRSSAEISGNNAVTIEKI